MTHGNSRSRVTRASLAIHARFHVRYTHVPGQNATKNGRYTNIRSGSRLSLVAQCGFHRKSTIWLYESTTFPRWGSTWRSRVAIHVVSGSRDLGVDGNSRVIHVPRAPRQFTKRVTRESGTGQRVVSDRSDPPAPPESCGVRMCGATGFRQMLPNRKRGISLPRSCKSRRRTC